MSHWCREDCMACSDTFPDVLDWPVGTEATHCWVWPHLESSWGRKGAGLWSKWWTERSATPEWNIGLFRTVREVGIGWSASMWLEPDLHREYGQSRALAEKTCCTFGDSLLRQLFGHTAESTELRLHLCLWICLWETLLVNKYSMNFNGGFFL